MEHSQRKNLEITNKNTNRLNESSLYSLMFEFTEQVEKYPAAHIDTEKDKRAKAIDAACAPLYASAHVVFTPSFNEYGNSVILVDNDMVVKYMTEEAALFTFHLDNFYKEIKKANNVQELQQYYKQFKLKPKQVLDGLIADLKLYAERYQFALDIKDVVTAFQAEKQRLANSKK